MAEPPEDLLGDDMLRDGWFPSHLKKARKRAGAGEERVALELLVENDDGRLFSRTKNDIQMLKTEMMDTLKHRRPLTGSGIRVSSAVQSSKALNKIRSSALDSNDPQLSSPLNSFKHDHRTQFNLHSYIQEVETLREVKELQNNTHLSDAILKKQLLSSSSSKMIRAQPDLFQRTRYHANDSISPKPTAIVQNFVIEENLPKSLFNSRSHNTSSVNTDYQVKKPEIFPYHQKIKERKTRPLSTKQDYLGLHNKKIISKPLHQERIRPESASTEQPEVNSFKPNSNSVTNNSMVPISRSRTPSPSHTHRPVDRPQTANPTHKATLSNPADLYNILPDRTWWKKQYGLQPEDLLDQKKPLPYFGLRTLQQRRVHRRSRDTKGPDFFGVHIVKQELPPPVKEDKHSHSNVESKQSSAGLKKFSFGKKTPRGSVQEFEATAERTAHSSVERTRGGRNNPLQSAASVEWTLKPSTQPANPSSQSAKDIRIQFSPMKPVTGSSPRPELLSPTGNNRKSKVRFNIKSRSNSRVEEKTKQTTERSGASNGSATKDPQVESVVKKSLLSLKIQRAGTLEESENMARDNGNSSPIVKLDTKTFSPLKENNLTEAEEEAIIKYIDRQTFSKNRIIRKVNEYLKTQKSVSGTLADYKEKLIQFHYDQFSKQLHERMQLIDLEEIFRDETNDLSIVEKREMVAAFLLGFSNNTRYQKFCKLFKNYITKVDEKSPVNNRIGILKGLVSVADLWESNFYHHVMRQGDYTKVKIQMSAQKLTGTKQPL